MFVTLSPQAHKVEVHRNSAIDGTPVDVTSPSTSNQTTAACLAGSAVLLGVDIAATFDDAAQAAGVPLYLLIWDRPAAEVNNDASAADPDGPAETTSNNAENYNFTAGTTIIMTFGNADGSSDVVTYVLDAGDFSNIAAATAAETAAALQAAITAAGLAHTAADSTGSVVLTNAEDGPYSTIVVSGTAAAVLDFDEAVGTVGTYTAPAYTFGLTPINGHLHLDFARPLKIGRDSRLLQRSGFSYAITSVRDDDTVASPTTASVEFWYTGSAS